jgi:hypothetical protein
MLLHSKTGTVRTTKLNDDLYFGSPLISLASLIVLSMPSGSRARCAMVAPFKDWVLPTAMERVRRKLASADDGDRGRRFPKQSVGFCELPHIT